MDTTTNTATETEHSVHGTLSAGRKANCMVFEIATTAPGSGDAVTMEIHINVDSLGRLLMTSDMPPAHVSVSYIDFPKAVSND